MSRLAAAAVVVAALVVIPSPAHADQTYGEPCVTKREYHSLYQQPKAELEKRWEVEGLGIVARIPFVPLVSQLHVYPRCGYTLEEAWYGVTYERRGKHLIAVWKSQCETWHLWTQVEGHPKTYSPCWDDGYAL